MPETPCGIEVDAAPGWATVRATYSFYAGERDLMVELWTPVASVFGRTASPPVHFGSDYPTLADPRWSDYRWPLMKIEKSSWLARHAAVLDDAASHVHLRFLSDDGSFDASWRHRRGSPGRRDEGACSTPPFIAVRLHEEAGRRWSRSRGQGCACAGEALLARRPQRIEALELQQTTG